MAGATVTNQLPRLGNLEGVAGFKVADSIAGFTYLSQGKHILLGQRRNRGSTKALILLGKCIEHGGIKDLFDANVWLDVEHPHIVFIAGKRGSGKSYDLGVVVEGLSMTQGSGVTTKDTPIKTVIFDTQNQFWTLASAPDSTIPEDQDQLDALRKWRLSAQRVPSVAIYRPTGSPSVGVGEREFGIAPNQMTLRDWAGLFGVDIFSPIPQLLRAAVELVGTSGWTSASGQSVAATTNYEIRDLVSCAQQSIELAAAHDATREALLWRLSAFDDTGLFTASAKAIDKHLGDGDVTVFLLRELDDAAKAVVVSVMCRRLFNVMGAYHMKKRISRRLNQAARPTGLPEGLWVVIDEAHTVAPAGKSTAALPTLIEYVKRGRDAGLSLLVATQQPSALDSAIISQADVNLTHRLVIEPDIDAAVSRFPARLPRNVKAGNLDVTAPSDLIRELPDGQALLGDSESGRGFLIAVRPRVSPHGGGEPSILDDAGTS